MSNLFKEYRVFVAAGGSTTIEPAIPTTEELNAEIARLRERIVKLEACVKAADYYFANEDGKDVLEAALQYDLARAALGEVGREG